MLDDYCLVLGEYYLVFRSALQHGAIVFLYHPCADPGQVDVMRGVARQCLKRHVISPAHQIPQGYNFALLAWGCKLLLAVPEVDKMVDFVKVRRKSCLSRSPS